MIKKSRLFLIKFIFTIILGLSFFLFCGNSNTKASTTTTEKESFTETLTKMNVAMIIAPNNFRDEELFDTKKVLEDGGANVTVFSTKLGKAKGMLGGEFEVTKLLKELIVDDYDAIIFVGGSGSNIYWNDKLAHKIAKEAVEKNKILGAICIAPVTLANSGVLKGKKATCWADVNKKLKAKGVKYTGESVTVDGKIITGNGPKAAKEFAQAIINKYNEK